MTEHTRKFVQQLDVIGQLIRDARRPEHWDVIGKLYADACAKHRAERALYRAVTAPRRKAERVEETPQYHLDDLVRAIIGGESNGNGH
jgi:hypothetical protein